MRVRELIATAKPLFPFAERAWENPLQHANVSIFLFRRPLPPEPFTPERMAERDRIGFLNLAVATTRFDIPEREHMEEVLAYLRGSNVFGTFDPRPEAALFRRPSSRGTRSSPRRR